MPQVCPNDCGTTSTVGNMVDHLRKCPNSLHNCSLCEFTAKRAEFLQHLVEKHEQRLVEDFDKNLKKNVEEEKKTGDAP